MQAMKRILPTVARCAVALMTLLLPQTTTVRGQGAAPVTRLTVNDVIIVGNQMQTSEQLKVQLRTQAGKEFNQDTIEEDVRTLHKTNQFSTVRADVQQDGQGGVKVYFLVRELPHLVDKVVFLGAKHMKDDDLHSTSGIYTGRPLNPNLNKIACQKIVQKYNEQGRPFASCVLVKGGQLGDTEVVFQITEGPKVAVKAIEFVGNHFVTGPRLATQVKSSTQWFHCIGGTYVPAMAEADINELMKYYRTFGFHDVRVSLETRWESDGSLVTLIFHIEEGQRYRVQDVPQVHGVKSVPHEQLEALSQVKPGDWYNEPAVTGDIKRIQDYIGYMGREARVMPETVWSKDVTGLCTVQYQVEERPPARVGQIFIIGNTRTRQNVILRQVPLYPGQILTYPDLQLAENNLKRLGIFAGTGQGGPGGGPDGAAPTVKVLDPESESVFKDLLVEVQETNTGSLIFGVGVNSNSGLTGSIVLNERNFDLFRPPLTIDDLFNGVAWRGAGQEFRVEAMPGTQLSRYMATFREPFLFDTPYSLTNSAYYYTRIYNEYYEQREGARMTLGRQFTRFWNVSLGGRIENIAVNNVPTGAPIDYQSVEGNNFLFGLRGSVALDTRDSFLRATRGGQLELSYEECLGEFTFPLINLVANKYWTTFQRADGSGRQVLVYHGQAGWAGTNTPVYERFFAGGFTTIRGFQFRGVGPDINGFKVGGDFLLLNSLEYQVPVKANDSIYLVGFVDSGTVGARISDINPYRVAAGFGIRFVVPMMGPVPIALDFGFPIVKGPNDVTQVFNFWMGFSR
jgi:outer membrane protein insertion porin family